MFSSVNVCKTSNSGSRGQDKPRKEKKWMTALVGVAAGVLSKKIDDRRIRKLVLLLLVVSGAMLIAQNL